MNKAGKFSWREGDTLLCALYICLTLFKRSFCVSLYCIIVYACKNLNVKNVYTTLEQVVTVLDSEPQQSARISPALHGQTLSR